MQRASSNPILDPQGPLRVAPFMGHFLGLRVLFRRGCRVDASIVHRRDAKQGGPSGSKLGPRGSLLRMFLTAKDGLSKVEVVRKPNWKLTT
jgi:hypothetical protein